VLYSPEEKLYSRPQLPWMDELEKRHVFIRVRNLQESDPHKSPTDALITAAG